MNEKIESLKGKLIVSCQALPHEPLHSAFIMGRMALVAKEGGAYGIRANTKEDIAEIQTQVDLPVIGIVKRDYEDSKVYITPTMKEINELMEVKPEIIAHHPESEMKRQLNEMLELKAFNTAADGRLFYCGVVPTQTAGLTLSEPRW